MAKVKVTKSKKLGKVKEIWKDVPEYEGYYQVSNLGRVKSLTRLSVSFRRGKRRVQPIAERILKPGSGVRGHVHVSLCVKGVPRQFRVHQLVMLVFVGKRPKGLETRHLNGIPDDNRLSNLQYGTSSENKIDAYDHGVRLMGGNHNFAKLSNSDVVKIRKLKGMMLQREVGALFGVNRTCISRIWNGKRRARG